MLIIAFMDSEDIKRETVATQKQTCEFALGSFICMLIWISLFVILSLYSGRMSKKTDSAVNGIWSTCLMGSPLFGLLSIIRIRFSKKSLRGYLLSFISILAFSLLFLFTWLAGESHRLQ